MLAEPAGAGFGGDWCVLFALLAVVAVFVLGTFIVSLVAAARLSRVQSNRDTNIMPDHTTPGDPPRQ